MEKCIKQVKNTTTTSRGVKTPLKTPIGGRAHNTPKKLTCIWLTKENSNLNHKTVVAVSA